MRDPVFPMFCAVGIVLCLLPLPWHWEARNTGTLIYICWTVSGCLIFMINALIWAGNTNDSAPIWCDISSRFVIALSIGLPGSSLCIQRCLYRVAAMKNVSANSGTRKKDIVIDIMIGVGLPFLVVILYYVVQAGRYAIVEDIGCWPVESATILIIPMTFMWPVLISFISFIYAAFTMRAFFKTRRQFSRVLSESGADLNMSRFFRLMALAGADMSFCLPFSLYFLISSITLYPLDLAPSWDEIHQYIHIVSTQPYEEVLAAPALKMAYDFNRWSIPSSAFLFFIFFGLSNEATKRYRLAYWRLVAPFGLVPPLPKEERPTTSWTQRLVLKRNTKRRSDPTIQATETTTDVRGVSSTSSEVGGSKLEVDVVMRSTDPYAIAKDLESQTHV